MKNKKVALIVMFVGAISSIVIQSVFPELLIEMFIQGLALLGVLVTIENEDEIQSAITKVYNRKAFLHEGMVSINNHIKFSVITIKLNNLKYYTEVLGVVRTNEVLKDIAQWLDSILPSCVYDCESGLFALMIHKQSETEEIISKIKEKLSEDWICGDIKIPFVTHICIIEVPKDADTIERLIAMVDTDYNCENNQRVVIITDDRLHMFQRENMVMNAIQRALDKQSFKVFYQPIWDKDTNTIHSAEALIRLFDDELGFIPPDEFIPISEKNGTIVKIGEFVFEDVCKMFSEYNVSQYGIDFIEVNLSTVQCMQKDLAMKFKELLDKYNVQASSINLEITESAAVNSPEMFLNTMAELKEMGFTFSMDDYGTGYSNYSYMFDLDFDIIKLDKSILWNADKNKKADIILKNTVRMIKEMNHNIVMEGVETEEQKKYVTSLGCDYCQGYYFSKPVDKDSFIEYCKNYNNY
jgi:EAL domain-containing protein (putative c-di-GMP-specific phosphodiesterase class I)